MTKINKNINGISTINDNVAEVKKSLTESNSLKVFAVAPTGPVTTAVGASRSLLKIVSPTFLSTNSPA